MTELTPFSFFELLEAFPLPGCPVCRVEKDIVGSYLDGLLHECVVDPDFDKVLKKTGGFCPDHAWALTDRRDPALGTAILYQRMVGELAEWLAAKEPLREITARLKERGVDAKTRTQARTLRSGLGSGFGGSGFGGSESEGSGLGGGRAQNLWPECLACKHLQKMKDCVLSTLIDTLEKKNERMSAGFAASTGLCFPHLVRGLELARTPARSAPLIARSRAEMDSLLAQLGEFIRKRDYRFASEGYGGERDSWLRAVARLVGEKS